MLPYIILAVIIIIVLIYYSTKSTAYETDVLIWFYRPGCGHCDRMTGEWEKFIKMQNRADLRLEKINTLENPKMAEQFGVFGVPYIVRVNNCIQTVYNGDRTAESLFAFSNQHPNY
jgi:thiol-disulfide isomerase/thioredoxin